jgi:transcriptional regulator with XRE-family HTH domain
VGDNRGYKLTDEQVSEIQAHLKDDKLTQREMAEMYGVSNTMISLINHGERHSKRGDHRNSDFDGFTAPIRRGSIRSISKRERASAARTESERRVNDVL